jgi:AAA family ATP:ADP antiporter
LPTIALLNASAVAFVPVLAVIWVGKIAENSVDYSINNTVRNMLWLPTTRDMKYKAKQAVDSFFVRAGDVTSALAVFVLADVLAISVSRFAVVNIVSVVIWVFLARAILREMKVIREKTNPETVTESGARA